MTDAAATTTSTPTSGQRFPMLPRLLGLVLSCSIVLRPSQALKHSFVAKDMHRALVGPLGFPFGFTNTGSYNLTVLDFTLSFGDGDHDADPDHHDHRQLEPSAYNQIDAAGFLLKRFVDEAAFDHYMNKLAANTSLCAFEPFLAGIDIDDTFSNDDDFDADGFACVKNNDCGIIVDSAAESGIFLSVMGAQNHEPYSASVSHEFTKGEEGLYFLLFQICPPPGTKHIHSKFELDFHFSNLDIMGNESYLSAGEMPLPHMFFYFALVYAVCLYLWATNIKLIGEGEPGRWGDNAEERQPVVFPIHHLMTMLVTLKFLSLFFESIRYHFLRVTGHAYFWSGIYYMFAFMKGTFLFTVILLLGSGWSFVKPFLGEREKTMVCIVLGLQVINNIAIVVLTQRTEGEASFDRWTALLHMVDILCCCAVLIPIVWHVNTLEKNMEQAGDHNDEPDEIIDLQEDLRVPEDEFEESVPVHSDSRLASKLKLFRSFYLLVVAYIYSTRIVVYLFATMLDYRHTWIRHFVIEAFTLTFYVWVGVLFRPMPENPYLTLKQGESSSNNVKEVELPAKSSKFKD